MNEFRLMMMMNRFLFDDLIIAETPTAVDEAYDAVVDCIRDLGRRICRSKRSSRKSKLSDETLGLMGERRQHVDTTSTEVKLLSKRIRKLIQTEVIEENKGQKVFVETLGRRHLLKLRNSSGSIASNKPEVLSEIEDFYGKLYASHALQPDNPVNDPRDSLSRHLSGDLPYHSFDEVSLALRQLKLKLSQIYKLFQRDMTNRLTNKLDGFEPLKQAGQRRGVSTIDHIFNKGLVVQ